MLLRALSFNADSPPSVGDFLKVKDPATGEVEPGVPSGGGGALVRSYGVLQGSTDAGVAAQAPDPLVITFDNSLPSLNLTLVVDSVSKVVNISNSMPDSGIDAFVDTSTMGNGQDIANALAALMGSLFGQVAANVTTVDSSYFLNLSSSSTGAAANISASMDNPAGPAISGGGSGLDTVPPSGEIAEVEIIPADGFKFLKPVRCGVYDATGLGSTVQFALKFAGMYFPIGSDIGAMSISAEVAPHEFWLEWADGRTAASLVARMTGSIPLGGTLTCWAIAEQN